jgi:hypothetical protein
MYKVWVEIHLRQETNYDSLSRYSRNSLWLDNNNKELEYNIL